MTSIKRVQEELREAKEKAIQASLAKSEFLATMSHELRTPLNGILGMNALMLRTDLDDRQRRYAEACESSGKLLTQLINDVLDVSKIEAGKLELDPRRCEIEAVVYDVVDIFTNAAQQKGLILNCRLSQAACVSAVVDDNRLRQILVNLVGNAIKFTSSGGVSIVGDHIKHSTGQSRLRIEVTDTGIGIPRERIDRLFKAFSQIDSSTTRQFGGTGLGLSICEQLVALMDGEIGVESQIGVGSTFWFEIPLEMIQSDKAGRRWQSLAAAQVVTVDCSDNALAQVAECVANWGCHCEEVETLSEALDVLHRLAAKRPATSVVLSTFRALESEPVVLPQLVDHCSGRVVALLTAQEEPSAQKMRSLGLRATLQEPVRPSELFETLTSLLLSINGDEVAESEPSDLVQSGSPQGKLVGHLLVAEDNQINQLYVVELLEILGCT
ncbi:MAG: ATP-binding protein, partial [Pirellulaceae bacterium]